MKFLRLEMLNLASLDREGGETIDFEEGILGKSNIFSIVGPTGSGKSTILDAICLALYGRAPRYAKDGRKNSDRIQIFGEVEASENNRLTPSDPRNILTRGKKDGYSKLTFLANNGSTYRAEWTIHFKAKKYEQPKTYLYNITVSDGVPVEELAEWNDLPQIIGLDYPQFLSTVLIAQGSFANFLSAKENERYELLEKLVGCKEMYTSITEKIKQKKEEAVRAFDQISANFSAQEKDIIPDEELEQLKARISELESVELRTKEELIRLSEALGWYVADERYAVNIVRYENIFNVAKQNLETFRTMSERLKLHDEANDAVILYKDIKASEKNIAEDEILLQKVVKEISEKKQGIENEVLNLEKLNANLKKASDDLEQQRPHINNARHIKAELDTLQKVLAEKNKAKRDAEAAMKKAQLEVGDKEESISLEEATARYNEETKRIEELGHKLKARNQEIDELLKGYDIESLENEFETLSNSYALMTSEKWEMHRMNLIEGVACPLCGATHHPYHDAETVAPVIDAMKTLVEEKRKTLKSKTAEKQKLANEQNKNNEQLLMQVERLHKVKARAEKAEVLHVAEEMLREVQAEVETKRTALRNEIGEWELEALEIKLTKCKDDAIKAVNDKTESIAHLREVLNKLLGIEVATTEHKQVETWRLMKRQEELDAWLIAYNQDGQHQDKLTVMGIAMLYAATDNWEQIRAKQRQVTEGYTSAQTTFNNEVEARKAHQESRPEQSKEDLQARKQELEGQSNTELVDLKARLQRHEIAKNQMGAIYEQKQEAETLKREWEEIVGAIGADGKTLRQIAQCYTLRFLVEHANIEIRRFNPRYELVQVKNSLGIRVIDHDRADDVRETTSLSGGETFIVSLGLALGLSALSSHNISFGNLFIDEGFGTLDPDTLASVLDSLARLQTSQGKKVGVISHTDTMSERITTQIRIVKEGHSGSSHIEIYPKYIQK